MSSRTQPFKMIPWSGGNNLTDDPSMASPNQLLIADSIEFGERPSKKKREGINKNYDSASDGSDTIIGLHDFWYGATTKTQKLVSVTTGKKIYAYASGTRTADLFAGTAWSNTPTTACVTTLNNLAIISVDGSSNPPKKFDGTNIADLGGTPPAFSISREHLGRLWTNDKTNCDRLQYSTTSNPEEWGGTGDSGAIDVGVGDGDPSGITAIFNTFQGTLFVAKRTKLYRIDGFTPEEFQITKVSDSIGCVSHNSIATIDESDIFFVSDRGVHSLATTSKYGDFEGEFVSADIQRYFNDSFTKSRRPYIWGAYNPIKNSYAIAVTDAEYSATANNAVWTYHLTSKSWARYAKNEGVSALITANDTDKKRWYGGATTGRVWQFNTSNVYDVNGSGTNVPISYKFKTPQISPTGDYITECAFKYLTLFFTQSGSYTLTATVQIDNYDPQVLLFSGSTSSDLLGSTFILGTSSLAGSSIAAPYTLPLDGIGRLISIQVENSGTNESIEVLGYAFGFEPIGMKQEVIANAS